MSSRGDVTISGPDDAIREVVENQLEERNPAEVNETLGRLMKAGYTRAQAVDKIGDVVVHEINDILKSNQPFDKDRYVSRLRELK